MSRPGQRHWVKNYYTKKVKYKLVRDLKRLNRWYEVGRTYTALYETIDPVNKHMYIGIVHDGVHTIGLPIEVVNENFDLIDDGELDFGIL